VVATRSTESQRVLSKQGQLREFVELDSDLEKRFGLSGPGRDDKIRGLWDRCKEDPEFYIFDSGFVRTFDEKDRTNPRKCFPDDKIYLRWALDHIHSQEPGDTACISKSRQIMLSWLVAAYATHQARFYAQTRVLIQSKKSDDAAALVYKKSWVHGRCSFIERAMPRFMRSDNLTPTKGELWYENGSVIAGIPQGSDQFRSYSASLVIIDEACFQDKFEDSYKAALPMCKALPDDPNSGGRIVIVTTAAAGTYYASLVEKDSSRTAA